MILLTTEYSVALAVILTVQWRISPVCLAFWIQDLGETQLKAL